MEKKKDCVETILVNNICHNTIWYRSLTTTMTTRWERTPKILCNNWLCHKRIIYFELKTCIHRKLNIFSGLYTRSTRCGFLFYSILLTSLKIMYNQNVIFYCFDGVTYKHFFYVKCKELLKISIKTFFFYFSEAIELCNEFCNHFIM